MTIIPTANVSAVGSNPSATAIILDDDISSTIVLQINPTGSNNSTAFTDSSSFNRLITTSGDTKILNNEAIFDGSGDFLSIPSSVDFAAGSGDMTIELKLKTTQTLLNATCLSRVSSGFGNGSWTILNGSGNKPVIYWADFSTSSPFLQSSIAINDGITHHLAWVKSGNIHTLYIDGTIANTLTTGTVMQNSGANLIIGNDLIFNGRDYAGAISGVCISKLARSPGNFGLA